MPAVGRLWPSDYDGDVGVVVDVVVDVDAVGDDVDNGSPFASE